MALKTYVGARYAPKFMGAWNKSNEYAALSVVYSDNQSYVSRKTVPAETEITNTEYWIRSSDWNAQMDQYRNQVDAYDEKVVQYNQNVEAYNTSVNNFFEETIHAYNTKEDMVKDQSIKEGYTLITCGESAIGDGSGAFYQAVTETSSGAVALENGLFAKKFQLMPERFNRWTVDEWSDVENLALVKGDIVTNLNTSNLRKDTIYAPCIPETSYTLPGIITKVEYDNTYPVLSYAPNLGDAHYFLLKTSSNAYMRFKILNFEYDTRILQEIATGDKQLYLLPHDVCTNEMPFNSNGIRIVVGDITNAVYNLRVHGSPNNKLILHLLVIGATTVRSNYITLDAKLNDFIVTIKGPTLLQKYVTASVANSAPLSAGTYTYTVNSEQKTYNIEDITGFILPHAISVTNSNSEQKLYINMGNVDLSEEQIANLPSSASDTVTLRAIIVPFNNTTNSVQSRSIYINCHAQGVNATTSLLLEDIPIGYSAYYLQLFRNVNGLGKHMYRIW